MNERGFVIAGLLIVCLAPFVSWALVPAGLMVAAVALLGPLGA